MLVPWARHWLLPAVSSLGKAAAALVGDAAPRLNSQRKHVVVVLLLGLHGLQPILGRDPDRDQKDFSALFIASHDARPVMLDSDIRLDTGVRWDRRSRPDTVAYIKKLLMRLAAQSWLSIFLQRGQGDP